jgi:hypothetical protein
MENYVLVCLDLLRTGRKKSFFLSFNSVVRILVAEVTKYYISSGDQMQTAGT